MDFLKFVYTQFGFSFRLQLSTRPEKYMGDISLWNEAEKVCGAHMITITILLRETERKRETL